MGSDFPHAEGFADPADFVKLLDGLSEAQQRKIFRDNAAKVFGSTEPWICAADAFSRLVVSRQSPMEMPPSTVTTEPVT